MAVGTAVAVGTAATVGIPSCGSWDPMVVLVYNFFIINDFFTQIRFSCSL